MARARGPELVRDVMARLPMRVGGSEYVLTDVGRFQNLATVRSGLDDEDETEGVEASEAESGSC